MHTHQEVTEALSSKTHLTSAEVAALDPYAFLAVLGKRVISVTSSSWVRSQQPLKEERWRKPRRWQKGSLLKGCRETHG